MDYDFDRIIERRATQSLKWRAYAPDVLPMWVADMDFAAPEPVIRALHERVEHGVFGYEATSEGLRAAVVEHLRRNFAWDVAPEALVFLPGVVTGFNLAVSAFVRPDEGLLIQTPVYPPILEAAETVGVQAQSMELTRTESGAYAVDMALFERTLMPQTRMFLLCNPHNPVGRVFSRDELTDMAELCLRHNLFICSDEIHADLVFSGQRHIPIASLAPEIAARTITLIAPSKTYNIAGLHCSCAIIPDADLRAQFNAARRGMVGGVNLLGYVAAEAAYREGGPWLTALLAYLEGNRETLLDFVQNELPGVRMARPEGTYLAWLDCRAAIPGDAYTFFLEQARVALNAGPSFGPGGAGFVRLNFGCPRALLLEGLERMRAALTHLPR